MKKILYIGNKLMIHGQTATTIETLGPMLESEGFTVYYASTVKNKFFRMCDMIGALLRRSFSIDYVIIDTYGAVNFWYALIISQLCRMLHIKYIPFLHGGDLPKRLNKSPFFCRLLFNHSYRNIAPSGYLISIFQQKGFSDIKYIPNTIDIANYPFKKRSSVHPKLLWVRAISTIYNPVMALDVYEQLLKKFPGSSLCIVGPDKNGYLPKVISHANKKNLDVLFTGRLSKPEWISLSQEYDVFINTTRYDNMPVSVIEAMALGLPVVSTNVGGIPFLLKNEETALLVESEDVTAMANSISRLVENPEMCERMVVKGREMVDDFDWKIVRQKWFDVLK
ncbi:glycosyltransferase family 4 protein [Flavobacterium silvaticum]|uniref:Glycosyltransferase family 4 protein n=1 Tax=Flavobacterium silvaticum TaxID=1852020 RepID=A0A972JHQ2_9FLAO|nr:glycosyltransferase family 4 protein [Flavobacterium silvaticum]NMH29471.1 glycosyltransferase family 4 protein [Flavobacterium silvaticum]